MTSAQGEYSQRRKGIQKWAKNELAEVRTSDIEQRVKLVFIVGKNENGDDLDLDASNSSCIYDAATSTLTVPTREHYANLIDKLLHFIVWAHESWHFTYLMKADDDTVVDVHGLLRFLAAQPQSRLWLGHFYTGAPVRDPSHKNYVSTVCYPLPCFPAYAWGGGYVLSRDLSGHLAANAEFYKASVLPRSCRGNIEDVQIGIFMMGLGVRPTHTPRFASVLSCTSRSVVLFDLPPSLQTHVGLHAQDSPPNTSLCTPSLRERNADVLKGRLRTSPTPSGEDTNNFALAAALALNCSAAIEGSLKR